MSKTTGMPARLVAKPLYGQVQQNLLDRIGLGEWVAGEPLPNESTLAAEFDVSIGTIRKAVEKLQDAGVLVRQQGRGTFIAGRGATALEQRLDRLRSACGYRPIVVKRRVLEHQSRPLTATEVARFGTQEGENAIVISQSVWAMGQRIGWEQSVLRQQRFPDFALKDGQSIYALLSERGALASRAKDRVSVVRADAVQAEQAGLALGDLAFVVDRRTFGLHEEVIELKAALYQAANLVYEVEV